MYTTLSFEGMKHKEFVFFKGYERPCKDMDATYILTARARATATTTGVLVDITLL
jgi:hypothetical protein